MADKSSWKDAWNSSNAMSTGMGVLQGVTSIASSIGKNAQIQDTEALDEQIDALRNTEFGYGDFDSLQAAYNPGTIEKLSAKDLENSIGEGLSNTLSATLSGASAGMAFGPVGAAVGAGVGLLGSIGGMWAGNVKAGKEASRLNREAEAAQREYLANFSNNAQNIAQSNFNRAALNLAAFGGMLKDNNINSFLRSRVRLAAFGGDMMSPIGRTDGFSNGVTKVDEGGSHETNPFDGVMMGVDPQGVPNLVEEGEVIFNDYVFSNRLAPTEEELESVKLPRKYAKKPYSKIAWDIQKESQENPLDKISKNTLVDSMMKLTTLQEQSRERDREYEEFSNLESVFADGGDIHIAPNKRGTFTAAAKRRGLGVQEFASKVLANKDKYSPAMVKKANFAHVFGGRHYDNGGDLNNNVNPKYKEDTDSLELAKSARIFSDILGNGKTLVENISSIPPYYKYGNGKKLFDEAYQSKLGAPNSWYVENENRVKQKLIEQADRIESNQKIHGFGGPMGNMFAYPFDEPNYMNRIIPVRSYFYSDPQGPAPTTASTATTVQTAGNPVVRTAPVRQPFGDKIQSINKPIIGSVIASSAPSTEDALKSMFGSDYANQPMFERPDLSGYYEDVEPETVEDAALPANAPKPQNNIPEFKTSWANTAMRAIPVIGSSINATADAFGWRNKEDYSSLDLIKQRENQIRNVRTSPIGRYMEYNPYDVDYEMNRLQNVGLGTQRALLDTAGGNALAARNAALALNSNLTNQMGAARRAGAQYNDELRRAVTQFNSGIDQFNANQALQAGVYNQRGDVERMEGAIRRAALMDAIQTATSQARSTEETAALNNWGQWGNDRTFADMAAWYQRYIAPYNDATRAYGQARADKGGKIKRIKEFKKK